MAHAGRPATKLQITDTERAELKAQLLYAKRLRTRSCACESCWAVQMGSREP